MDISKLLKENFEEVKKAFFEKEMGYNFLRIEVTEREIKAVEEISRKISEFLDENDPTDSEYYLDVYSPGTDESFEAIDSKDHVGENVLIELVKPLKGFETFEGELLSADAKQLVVRWNAKGQFRKQEINIDDIKNIKKYSKVKK